MSLAHPHLPYSRSIDGNTARALPEVERGQRSQRRTQVAKRSPRDLIMVGVAVWLVLMAAVMFLIYRNSLVLKERSLITDQKEQLVLLQQANQELEAKMVQAVSVGEVERWAKAHGMNRPQVVKSLKPDTAAVAVAPAGQAESLPNANLWTALRGYIARMGVFSAGAAR